MSNYAIFLRFGAMDWEESFALECPEILWRRRVGFLALNFIAIIHLLFSNL